MEAQLCDAPAQREGPQLLSPQGEIDGASEARVVFALWRFLQALDSWFFSSMVPSCNARECLDGPFSKAYRYYFAEFQAH